MFVDDGSLGQKEEEKKKEVMSVEAPKPSSQDLAETDTQTDYISL